MEREHWKTFILSFLLVITFCRQTYGQNDLTYISDDQTSICDASNPVSQAELQQFTDQSKLSCLAICMSKNLPIYKYKDGLCTPVGNEPSPVPSIGVRSWRFSEHIVQEVALMKPSESVPYSSGRISGNAVDGIQQSYFLSPNTVPNPWWFVDLGNTYIIKEVHVLATTSDGSHASNFIQIKIRVGDTYQPQGDFTSYTLAAIYPGPPAVGSYAIVVPSHIHCGRYVSIQKSVLTPQQYMALSEVKVYAYVKA